MGSDDELDRAVARLAPQAPRDFGAAVEARLRKRARRGQRLAVAGALATLAAAAMVVLLLRPSLPSRPSSGSSSTSSWSWPWSSPPALLSYWRVVTARAASLVATDGTRAPLAAGQPLHAGDLVAVEDGGEARLGHASASLTLSSLASARVGEHELSIEQGEARLEGPEARVVVNGTVVTALGPGAVVAVQTRRNEMNPIKNSSLNRPIMAAATVALVAVSVHYGAARVLPAGGHGPVLLAANDHALVAGNLPPLVTRNRANAGELAAANKPATVVDGNGEEGSSEMKDAIRDVMRGELEAIRGCYETALAKNPGLAGRVVMQIRVKKQGTKGVVEEAEVVPSGASDLASPATEQCMLEAISRAAFPAPVGDDTMIISYPFVLATKEPPPEETPAPSAKPKADDSMQLLQPHF